MRGTTRKPNKIFPGILAIFLMFALTTPAWAGGGGIFTNPAPITVNDAATALGIANPYPSSVTVAGMTGTVTNVTLTINNFNHTFPDDVDMLLVGPGLQNLIVVSDVGGSDDAYNRTFTIDDAATPTMPDGVGFMTGTSFKPTNIGAGDAFLAPAPAPSANTTMAAAFNGIDPNGVWNLYIQDDLGVDVGAVGNGWSLTVTTSGTSATTFTNGAHIFVNDRFGQATPYASTIVVSGLVGAITDVDVTLTNVNHLNPDDLDILLVSSTGRRIVLLSDAGGTGDAAGVNLTFDDAAAAVVPDAGPLATGSVRPTNFGTGETVANNIPIYPSSATAGPTTLGSAFNGTDANGTWSLYVIDDATASTGSIMGGWSLDIAVGGQYGAKRFSNTADFDGDGISDVSVFRSSDNTWYTRDSRTYANRAFGAFGTSGDELVPGDYDGDNKTDFAVFRPSEGRWYIVQSSTSSLVQTAWGTSGDTPVPADYDGDGKTDVAVWRAGVWHVLQSMTSTGRVVSWGIAGDVPVRGHFEGTNGADFTVYRSSENIWYILNNPATSSRTVNFGAAGDLLVPGDYDGDSKTDVAIYRPSVGDFRYISSATSAFAGLHLGVSTDVPVPGDYDGDSRTDFAVWRPSTGSWYLIGSGTTALISAARLDHWGVPTDTPIATTYLP